MLQKLQRSFRAAEIQKRYEHNISHVKTECFVTQQWQPTVNQA